MTLGVKDTLNPDLILNYINQDMNSEKKKKAKIGERYYEADHDIKQYKVYYVNDEGEFV